MKNQIIRLTETLMFTQNNFNLLKDCAEAIIGIHDFSLFCKEKSRKENNECEIKYSKWVHENNRYSYKIVGNRFLHHMVRFLVGTMIEVGKSRITFDNFCNLLKNKESPNLIIKAPPCGLYLNNVYYYSVYPFHDVSNLF